MKIVQWHALFEKTFLYINMKIVQWHALFEKEKDNIVKAHFNSDFICESL